MLKTNRSDICRDRYVYMLLLFYIMFPFCNHKELRSCKIYQNNVKNENEGYQNHVEMISKNVIEY